MASLGRQLEATMEDKERGELAQAEAEAKHAQLLTLQDDAVKFTLQCLADQQADHAAEAAAASAAAAAAAADGDDAAAAAADAAAAAAPLSLATLDATKRHEVLGYLLSQLQAYQQQLREVQLQSRWREHAAQASPPPPSHHLPPLVPPPSHASAAAYPSDLAAASSERQPPQPGFYRPGFDADPAFGAAGGDVSSIGVQTQGCEARGLATLSQEQGRMRGGDPSAYGGPPAGSIMQVDGPVRPWGKRSKALPLAAGRTRGPAVRGRY